MALRAVGVATSGAGGSLTQGFTNNSAVPGNTTINTPSGRASIAAAASSCTVTNSTVTANSKIFVTLESADATLTFLLGTTHAAGSFTVTGNAAATGNCTFSFIVIN